MLESGKRILPVFYRVEVAHLRHPYDGPFAAGLREHKNQGRHQDVKRWETALAKVADLQGFRLAEFNDDEAQLLSRIVREVQRALPARRLLQLPSPRVGLEESLKVVIKKLNLMGDSVGVIGVFGMGGIGKTKLVEEVYDHFAMEKRFEEQSFLRDVRGSTTDPLVLQKQLVYDLLQEDLQSSVGFSNWFKRFARQKVLIVVDDIDHWSQFKVLIPDIDKLARGSRILVTSRDQNVLSNIMRGDGHLTAMHQVELMSPHDSHQLFNLHAFDNEKASDGFQDLATKVADACCCLPLALQVIGAFLFDKKKPEDRDCWHQVTETLRANGDILNQLKISYDGLPSDEARLMFQDIACFFIGKDEQMAMQIFESSSEGPQVSFHALMDKSLVTLDSNRRIRMHDLLRDMGRNVVTKQSQIEGQRSHLWDPAMAERVLRKNQGTDRVRGLSVAGAKDGAAWKAETYTRMSELHFLILDHCQVKGDFSRWSEELRWLQWWSLPLSELPPTLSLLNLSVLDLTGSKSNLNLHGCSTLKALPDSVGELVELTQLNLSNCRSLERLPDTIGFLSKLKKLWLINCTELKFLPTEFGKLQRLDEFWADATSLSRLPHSFSQLSNLEDLHLHKCEKIQELPSMNGLVKLKFLDMGHIGVQTLPEDFGHLQNLVDLHLYSCKHLQTLPQSFGLLQLQRLQMNGNFNLKMLPKGFGGLKALVDLNISNNSFQQGGLPSDFGRLSALKRLQLQYNYMVSLPEGFKELQALVFLEIHHCPNLVDVQGLPWSLEYLDLGDCPKLIDIPSLKNLHSLKSLILCNCTSLTQLQDLDSLITLEKVNLSGCTMLQNAPTLSHNGGLEACYLSGSYVSMPIASDWLKCSMEARIIRKNEEVFISHLFKLREADHDDQVYFCTLRRRHPFVQALKHGDKICVYARSRYQGWAITVNEAAICVVYSVLGEIHVVENGTIEGDSNVDASEGESESSQGTNDEEDRVASTAAPSATTSSGPSSFASRNECSAGGKDKEDREEDEDEDEGQGDDEKREEDEQPPPPLENTRKKDSRKKSKRGRKSR
ncbi:unnamed protein product [Sphagnum tenellum]